MTGDWTTVARRLPVGKLPADLLESLLQRYGGRDPRLVVGPKAGEDAAVIAFGDRYLLAKTDPITFATDEIGWYAVNVNANDIAVMGGRPCWFLATVLLPAGQATPEMADAIFAQIYAACEELGIALAGGHTEVTYGLDRPLVIGAMLGEVERDRLVTKAGARPGDAIVLVKAIPIEGAALIAREKRAELRERGYSDDWVLRIAKFLHNPGISVLQPAQIACQVTQIHAMHDPTEGGLATGLAEIARAAEVGLIVDLDAIPVLPEGERLCAEFGLDPLGTIASGSLLVVLPEEEVPVLRAALEAAGHPVAVIGRVQEAKDGVWALQRGQRVPLPCFPTDEIAKLFS
ncbi:MAG: AIR synthase family protein [Anaerolineae bacterium]|nr:AIR synthase family protein [Anaerolineae bacterium]MDW8101143.1 AIR synthase family protein [Anaerolineae bacterium]